jgi:hypothetical protein
MPSAPTSFHLLIANAVPPLTATAARTAPPALPRLEALPAHLRPAETLNLDPNAPDTPFERALAHALGLPHQPGQVPWAAYENQIVGVPCAWIHPCQWQLGLDSVALLDPAQLQLTESESHALLAPIQALMAEDGMQLRYVAPDAWLVQGELFRGLTTWSIRRAAQGALSRDALATAPTEVQKNLLRRHQSEWQMLLHNQPVNDAREAAGNWFVNALWTDGAGVLDHMPAAPAGKVIPERRLEQAGDDEMLRTAAWQTIEREHAEVLHAALQAGSTVRLTFCGPHSARSYVSGGGLGARLSHLLHPVHLPDLCAQL